MDGTALVERAVDRAQELPGAQLTHPFGEGWEVYKVSGRVFLLTTALRGVPLVNLKARPADGVALRRAFASIAPGYHMDKRHWITLRGGEDLDGELVDDLVTESYLLVLEKLPRRARPVDPEEFARVVAARLARGPSRS
ncbi:MmcQ/YjbR family DNA-binding protein [Brachybacterium hainanense]|uniref:MmcQ/YjbR family DNA-binding protein n=1 Tax=Brachybacterium hainanense TaxID=1541174 RepID=A0ABV6RA61_9MICO